MGSNTYQAIQVEITVTGYTIFNVTTTYQSVLVFKTTTSGYTELNSSNYWASNDKVYVFDDPSNTYYVANTATTGTTTTQQSSTTTQQSTTTSSTVKSSSTTATIIVFIVIIAIIVAALAIARRK
ncbi:MAG: hypothetical protein QXP58_07655 [Thermoprotei archaeon]